MIKPGFHYPFFWSVVLWGYLILVFTLGLMPGSELDSKLSLPYLDKLLHFSGYFALGIIFHQLLDRPPRALLIKGFVIGLIIELLQTQVPGRSYETLDLLANTLGMLCGLIFSGRVFQNGFKKLERLYRGE
jgi:VanZ family protein